MSTEEPTRPISPLLARYLTASEQASLRAVPADDLAIEIKLLRVVSAHFLEFQQSAPTDQYSRQQTLYTGLISSAQMARLVRAHNESDGPNAAGHVREIRIVLGKRHAE